MKRADIEALQLERLRRVVDYCYENVPFYHARLSQAGITSGNKIKALSDLQYIRSPRRRISGTTIPLVCWRSP